MDKRIEFIVKEMQEKFNATLDEFREEVHLLVPAEHIVEILTAMRDEQKFELLSALTASDYWPQVTPRFHVIYQLTSIERNLSLQPRRILMPDDTEGHPLRKDYPLGYEEPQFTFNFDEIRLTKPAPKE
jgi:NADH-quinone oxidoreductase subunit C